MEENQEKPLPLWKILLRLGVFIGFVVLAYIVFLIMYFSYLSYFEIPLNDY
jgi:hypothetical protein